MKYMLNHNSSKFSSKDKLKNNTNDTTIVSKSDVGKPIENDAIPVNVDDGNDLEKLDFSSKFSNPNNLNSSDKLTGTEGVNTYDFNILLNAKPEIYQKHANNQGKIDWKAVAGENDNYHDHWVEGIGNDTIADFSGVGGDGDRLSILGHTVAAKVIEELDNKVTIGIYSDQGADGNRGDGAHDLDILGTIEVNHDGHFSFDRDVRVDPNLFYGAFESI